MKYFLLLPMLFINAALAQALPVIDYERVWALQHIHAHADNKGELDSYLFPCWIGYKIKDRDGSEIVERIYLDEYRKECSKFYSFQEKAREEYYKEKRKELAEKTE